MTELPELRPCLTLVQELFDRIEGLDPPAQLRLAAELLENGRGDLACAVVKRVESELALDIRLRVRGQR